MELNRSQRRKRSSGSFRDEQKKLRASGKSYKSYKGKEIPARSPPEREVSCKCYLDCKKLDYERKLDLFQQFYAQNAKSQGTYLMGLMSFCKVKRRRHGGYEDLNQSRRQGTICYTVPDKKGEFVRVCKKTFLAIFAVSKKRVDVLISKKKMGETCFVDKRTNHKMPKFSHEDRQLVKAHINMVPRDVGHYSRAKSNKEYISPDLNLHRLHRAFLEQHPDSLVTYKFYESVFRKDFPNVCFRRPRVDTCALCDKLNCEIRANISSSHDAKVKLDIHHRKAEQSRNNMWYQTDHMYKKKTTLN